MYGENKFSTLGAQCSNCARTLDQLMCARFNALALLLLLTLPAPVAAQFVSSVNQKQCPLAQFAETVLQVDQVCCTNHACEGGKLPTKCSVLCAERFVTFHDRCKSSIDRMFDNSDHEEDGRALAFDTFYDTCLDEKMIDSRTLLDRAKNLRAKGCRVDLSGIVAKPSASKGGHRRRRRRAQLLIHETNCKNVQDLNARARTVNTVCCRRGAKDSPQGAPRACSADCALVFVDFFHDCRVMLKSAFSRGQVQTLETAAHLCLRLPLKGLMVVPLMES